MLFYMAPMEGLTGYIVRNAYHRQFANIDKYFTPFIPAGKRLNEKYIRDLDPKNNVGITLVPQLMTNDAEEVLMMHKQLEVYGYDEVNINFGCPSGTVVSKKRGSGILAYPQMLEHFLEELYSKAQFPVSIKTRIGFATDEMWEELAEIYGKYPISELIIHPRTKTDMYTAPVRLETFAYAVAHIPLSLCYNGDIVDKESFENMQERFPSIDKCMIGRGIFANPGLISEIQDGKKATLGQIRAYHDEILEEYLRIFSGEKDAIFRMKEHWSYLGRLFTDDEKYLKIIRKSNHMTEYKQAVGGIFANCPMR